MVMPAALKHACVGGPECNVYPDGERPRETHHLNRKRNKVHVPEQELTVAAGNTDYANQQPSNKDLQLRLLTRELQIPVLNRDRADLCLNGFDSLS